MLSNLGIGNLLRVRIEPDAGQAGKPKSFAVSNMAFTGS